MSCEDEDIKRGVEYVCDVLRYLGDHNAGSMRTVGELGDEQKRWLNAVAHLLRGIHGTAVAPNLGSSEDELVFTQFMGSFSAQREAERGSGRSGSGLDARSSDWNHAISGVLRNLRAHQTALLSGNQLNSATGRQSGPENGASDELAQLMQHVNTWSDFNVFRVSELSAGRPLQVVAMRAFKDMNLIDKLQLDEKKLASFVADVEACCPRGNHYHNSMHVADVTQGVLAVLSTDNCANQLTNVEILALLVAAIIHDVNHPGVNNSFLVQMGTDEALLYNDASVNENGHIALGFRLLNKPQNMFLANLCDVDYRHMRRLGCIRLLFAQLPESFMHACLFVCRQAGM
mmetsp:Transcript_37161/g.109627  ORF Transcript_37161/g.109627 Transcript_37161/m.109627 type:complete len:345 (-) Transcript_37161:1626-2660(-)